MYLLIHYLLFLNQNGLYLLYFIGKNYRVTIIITSV